MLFRDDMPGWSVAFLFKTEYRARLQAYSWTGG